MKHISLFISSLMLLFSSSLIAQTCCSMSAGEEFALLGKQSEFKAGHEYGKGFVFDKEKGENIRFMTSDGDSAQAFLLRNETPSNKYIFVIHEWWGLNDHIKREAYKIFTSIKDVNVLCLDLYDGKSTTVGEEAAELMTNVKGERAEAIIEGALGYAGDKAEIASIGWCFGGGWSLQTAILAGSRQKACIIYYGMPEKNTDKLKMLESPVLGIFASKDEWINTEVVEQFEKNMEKAGKKLQVFTFAAEHAFANPSSPNYRSETTNKAWEISLDFLRNKMK